jgi:hypothetical protein
MAETAGLEATKAWLFNAGTKAFEPLALPHSTAREPIDYARRTLGIYVMTKSVA